MSTPAPPAAPPPDPLEVVRSRAYLKLLVLAALIGIPISAAAYFFLQLVTHLQDWLYKDLPAGLGFDTAPVWWPLPLLVVCGLLVGLTIQRLPGRGGASPADGFSHHAPPTVEQLPGVALAALTTLGLGAVLGPEAPLIALGGGLAVAVLRLPKKDPGPQAFAVIGAAGSFAAVATLLGSPLLGAFLLMEVSAAAGSMLSVMLLPGLLAAGVGTLVFTGLDSITGLGVPSLALPGLPPFERPDIAEFGYALVIGVLAAIAGTAIHRLGLLARVPIERRLLIGTPIAGAAVALLAMLYQGVTVHGFSDVLFSGETGLPTLLSNSASYSVGALLVLLACKGVAYGISLAGFRGGPIFPSMFLGAAGGIALSHLPGLPLVPAVAMGIGGMCVAMLRLPFTSVLLATLLLESDGIAVTPLVIVTVVVAHVITARLSPPAAQPAGSAQPSPSGSSRSASVGPQEPGA